MEFTEREEKFLEPYLSMDPEGGRGWVAGVAAGALICAAGVFLWLSGLWPHEGYYLLLIFVVGLVIIEQSLNHRDNVRLARILQKYESLRGESREES